MSTRLDQLLKLHTADPSDAFCLYGIALEHAKANAHAVAIDWLNKTLAADPNYCYAYYQKAKMLIHLGQPADAKAVIEQGMAIAKKVNDQHALAELAALLDAMG